MTDAACSGGFTVADALRLGRTLGVERLDAQWLLAQVLDRPRSWLIAHDDARLSPTQEASLRAALAGRAAGVPLAYLMGVKEFHGLTLKVNPSVLVPRADTEVLVDWAIELLTKGFPGMSSPRVADLGTGSGAIALAVKRACPSVTTVATDISAAALAVARENAVLLGCAVEFREGPWWAPLKHERFHLVLSNPPYIAADDSHLAALRDEPSLALTPGGDGLDSLREIIKGANAHIEPGGWLLLEHGYDQAEAVRALLGSAGFTDVQTRQDLGGHGRCSGAHR